MSSFIKNNKMVFIILFIIFIVSGVVYLRLIHNSQNMLFHSSGCSIKYTEAPEHIGDNCKVEGNIKKVYISKKGTVFLDFCYNYKTCPFGVVIFKSYSDEFPNIKDYEHRNVYVSGLVSVYKGRAEMLIKDISQISL